MKWSDDIKSVSNYIASGECKKIFLMLGAGVSTSAGIPDFRSPETGLYANLAKLKLPYPEAVFEINYFQRNPLPFYTLAQDLYPGHFRPTPTHTFIKLLNDKSLLHTCFTQNIDTLERRAGVPADKIVEAHGSFATSNCIRCKRTYDNAMMKEKVLKKEIPRCTRCGGLAKPDIVFFGEGLPGSFFQSIPSLSEADLLIIMGTSLQVHPFASLTDLVPKSCPRVLINIEEVGGIGIRPNDVVLLGKCDEIIRELCQELGWEKELDEEWAKTADTVERDMTLVLNQSDGFIANGEEVQEGGLKDAEEEANDLTNAIERYMSLMGLDGGDDYEDYSSGGEENTSSPTKLRNEQLSKNISPESKSVDDNAKTEVKDPTSVNPMKKL